MISSNMSLPTDNLYKFLALFGLLLTVTGCYMFNSSYTNFNNEYISSIVELAKYESIEKPTPYELRQKEALEKIIELLKANKPFNLNVSMSVIIIGLITMFYGFYRWHYQLQPKLDELLDLQVAKSKLEVQQLKKTRTTRLNRK
ncbi:MULTISPECIES: hypothetical protein [Vibrio]|uniref:hypothetical protein n=1 Tax=Vibrio TaxID=662 RepID=UPI00064565F3|nr:MULTISPECIES: hypothetical protein [Vibrio]ELB2044562.1 hypothetical protein [Vibrio parahaemolyticus]